jgi:hypothetical protein
MAVRKLTGIPNYKDKDDWVLEVFGKIIRLALKDYIKFQKTYDKDIRELRRLTRITKNTTHKHGCLANLNNRTSSFESARNYLFNENWLEGLLVDYGIDKDISISYIRRVALSSKDHKQFDIIL